MVNSPERSSVPADGDALAAIPLRMTLQGATLSQSILQQVPGQLLQRSFPPANEVVTAMQHLIEAVAHPSSASGLPLDEIQSSEMQQSAERVVQALQSYPLEVDATRRESLTQHYVCLKDLTPWLLWGIARSAYGAMRLLEGTAATVLQPDQRWQSGILRLVAFLAVKTPSFSYSFDLVTQQAVPEILGNDRLIQLGDSTLYPKPTTIVEATRLLVAQIQTTTPALQPFLQDIHTEILIPGQSWQPATLQLQLGFEFTPTPTPSTAFTPRPAIRFTHPGWIEEYVSAIAHQSITQLLPDLPSLQLAEPEIPVLIQDAQRASQRWKTDLTLTSRNFLQQNLQLDELALRLLWCFSHSAYDVMQLMSGIAVSLLQPDSSWQTGTLRLWMGLTVQTPELDWCLDLMTGQSPEVRSTAVALNSVVRSPQVPWLYQPLLLEQLDAKIRQHIAQATPELLLIMQGAEVDLLDTDNQWQPGVVRLSASFEFIGDVGK
ncbi:MAG TPA: hypothetical protein V6C57_21930 [Coleofasciculaceae cyanobacterium]